MEIAKLFNALPSAGSQGVIWGIMAIGVYITYRILDVADLTVDGSIATGGAVAAVLIIGGCNVWVAMVAAFLVGMLAGLATGIFHTFMGIPAILAGILTQLSLYSINLRILGGKANMAVSVNNYPLLVSARNARVLSLSNPIFILAALAVLFLMAGIYLHQAVYYILFAAALLSAALQVYDLRRTKRQLEEQDRREQEKK